MSLITDLRAVSESAVEQLAGRFSDLPRPLLAAIGAGDIAIERLAEMREMLTDSIGDRLPTGGPSRPDVRAAVSDLPTRAQKVAADVASGIEQFAAQAPSRAQELIGALPERLAEFSTVTQSMSPLALRETVDAYTHLVGLIYANLAERGDRTWSKARTAGPKVTVVDAEPPAPTEVIVPPPAEPPATASTLPAHLVDADPFPVDLAATSGGRPRRSPDVGAEVDPGAPVAAADAGTKARTAPRGRAPKPAPHAAPHPAQHPVAPTKRSRARTAAPVPPVVPTVAPPVVPTVVPTVAPPVVPPGRSVKAPAPRPAARRHQP